MKHDARAEYIMRDSIVKLLSSEEVASASIVETAARLPDGDEYLDLEQLDHGLQRAPVGLSPWGLCLQEKPCTWSKILTQLAALGIATTHSGA